MSNLMPVDPERIKKDVELLHAVLDSNMTTIPGDLSEALASGKSLLRAILGGELYVCFEGEVETSPEIPIE
jgi:hypothetical protein